MKVGIYFCSLWCLTGGLAAQNLNLTFGGGLSSSKSEQWLQISDSSGAESYTKDSMGLLGAEIWVDSTFLEIKCGYFHSIFPAWRELKGTGTLQNGTQVMESATGVVNYSLWGKYPMTYGQLTFAPTLGFTFSKNLIYSRPPIPSVIMDLWTEEAFERDDLFLQGGINLDWRMSPNWLSRLSGSLGLNMNTQRQRAKSYAQTMDLDLTHGGTIMTLALGMGYTP